MSRQPARQTENSSARLPTSKLIKAVTVWSAVIATAIALQGCSIPRLQFPGVYKIDIQQGNIITQEMIDELRPGMTKRQVIFVMGTPLVRDPFDQDRWDYVYSYQPGGGIRGQEKVTMYFEDDLLTHFSGDFKPTEEAAPAASSATNS